MWMFCKDGFFSAVENREDNEQVMVRARDERDIRALGSKLGVEWRESGPLADYPFRLVCTKVEWAKYLAEAAVDIDYDNFKDAMSTRFDRFRLEQLHEVWEVMRRSRASAFGDYDSREPTLNSKRSEYSDEFFGDSGRSEE